MALPRDWYHLDDTNGTLHVNVQTNSLTIDLLKEFSEFLKTNRDNIKRCVCDVKNECMFHLIYMAIESTDKLEFTGESGTVKPYDVKYVECLKLRENGIPVFVNQTLFNPPSGNKIYKHIQEGQPVPRQIVGGRDNSRTFQIPPEGKTLFINDDNEVDLTTFMVCKGFSVKLREASFTAPFFHDMLQFGDFLASKVSQQDTPLDIEFDASDRSFDIRWFVAWMFMCASVGGEKYLNLQFSSYFRNLFTDPIMGLMLQWMLHQGFLHRLAFSLLDKNELPYILDVFETIPVDKLNEISISSAPASIVSSSREGISNTELMTKCLQISKKFKVFLHMKRLDVKNELIPFLIDVHENEVNGLGEMHLVTEPTSIIREIQADNTNIVSLVKLLKKMISYQHASQSFHPIKMHIHGLCFYSPRTVSLAKRFQYACVNLKEIKDLTDQLGLVGFDATTILPGKTRVFLLHNDNRETYLYNQELAEKLRFLSLLIACQLFDGSLDVNRPGELISTQSFEDIYFRMKGKIEQCFETFDLLIEANELYGEYCSRKEKSSSSKKQRSERTFPSMPKHIFTHPPGEVRTF